MSNPTIQSAKPNKNAELAMAMAALVELLDVRLMETQARCVPAIEEKLPERLRYHVNHECALDRNSKRFAVMLHLIVDALQAGETSEPLLHVEAKFLLAYVVRDLDDLTDAHCEAFADLNALFNVWPYWREYVQSITTRMGLPGLVLPVYRFGQRFTDAVANPPTTGSGPTTQALPKV